MRKTTKFTIERTIILRILIRNLDSITVVRTQIIDELKKSKRSVCFQIHIYTNVV